MARGLPWALRTSVIALSGWHGMQALKADMKTPLPPKSTSRLEYGDPMRMT